MSQDIGTERCEECGHDVPSYDTINLTVSASSRVVCMRCFNARIAGVDFAHPSFEPIVLHDAAGVRHEFHFRTRHGGAHVGIEAFELEDGHPGG
jgi:hypothetical protein